jgi:DNA-binding MarR family transcriptional regulator
MRRLRVEHRFPIHQGAVLGRLDREGSSSVSDLAAAEKVRPQSMAQTVGELEADGLVKRRPDPYDRRRALVELTPAGRDTLEEDRGRRVGWPRPGDRRAACATRRSWRAPQPSSAGLLSARIS